VSQYDNPSFDDHDIEIDLTPPSVGAQYHPAETEDVLLTLRDMILFFSTKRSNRCPRNSGLLVGCSKNAKNFLLEHATKLTTSLSKRVPEPNVWCSAPRL